MKYIIGSITVFLVPVVLNIISYIASKSTTDSIYHFIMKPTKAILIVGWPCAIIFLFCIIGSNLGGQFKGLTAWVFSIIFIIGVLLILTPIKGFYDTEVDGNSMRSSRFWIIKKTTNIPDIDYCIRTEGGISVYVRGDNKKVLHIDGMSTNLANFEKRMQKEGIEIRIK